MTVTTAEEDDLAAAMNVLDGADLDVSVATVRTAIDRNHVLVARSETGTVLGALVCVDRDPGVRVDAIAVRPNRRDQGIGSALIEAAGDRWDVLVARFEPGLWPFYDSLGFVRAPALSREERRVAARRQPD